MSTKSIKYKAGYKYQLVENFLVVVEVPEPASAIWGGNDYVRITSSGLLTITEGYAWDGPSGPTFDTKTFMRGSLVHDALYQLMRESYLPLGYRKTADKVLYRLCREDGMFWLRAKWVYAGIRLGGSASVHSVVPVITAP